MSNESVSVAELAERWRNPDITVFAAARSGAECAAIVEARCACADELEAALREQQEIAKFAGVPYADLLGIISRLQYLNVPVTLAGLDSLLAREPVGDLREKLAKALCKHAYVGRDFDEAVSPSRKLWERMLPEVDAILPLITAHYAAPHDKPGECTACAAPFPKHTEGCVLKKIRALLSAEQASAGGQNAQAAAGTAAAAWKEALVEALIVRHILTKENEADPKKALHDLIGWEQLVTLDPTVSSAAAALVAQARLEEAKWWSRRTVTYGLDNGCASLLEEQQRIAILEAAARGPETAKACGGGIKVIS